MEKNCKGYAAGSERDMRRVEGKKERVRTLE
jgi:hypothetical protein